MWKKTPPWERPSKFCQNGLGQYTSSREGQKPQQTTCIVTPCIVYDYGELFWWSTRLWQLFLLKSWAVLLIVVVRIADEILPRFQTPCLLNDQTEKFQKAICSRKSRHRAAYSHVSQPLNPWQGRTGRGRPRRGAYRFEPEIVKKAEMHWGAVPGCSCCRAFPMITTMSIKDSATMTGRLHLSLFVFSLQFIFGCVIQEKRVPQHSQTRTSWTRSHGLAPRHAPPFPALNSRGWRGLTYASVEEADHQWWIVSSIKHCIFSCLFCWI